jgi:hypothetical protein
MKIETRFGLIVLLLSIIWKTSLFAFGARDTFMGQYSVMFVMLFMLLGIYLGLEELRKTVFGGKLSFQQGFKSGMMIAFLHSIFYSLFLYVYYAYIDVTFFAEKIEARVAEARAAGNTEESIESFRQSAEQILSPSVQSTFSLVGLLVLSAFYAGIIAKMIEKKHGAPRM